MKWATKHGQRLYLWHIFQARYLIYADFSTDSSLCRVVSARNPRLISLARESSFGVMFAYFLCVSLSVLVYLLQKIWDWLNLYIKSIQRELRARCRTFV